MIRRLQQRSAIKRFVKQLPLDLRRRHGMSDFYSLEQMNRAVKGGPYDAAFVSYAHALFCSREEFDAHYGPLKVRATYDGHRAKVARRFFGGAKDFDAKSIIRYAGTVEGDQFYESGIAD